MLFVAAEGKDESEPTAERWEGYVSGAVTEFRLPCVHWDMARPDMLLNLVGGVWASRPGRSSPPMPSPEERPQIRSIALIRRLNNNISHPGRHRLSAS